MNKKIATVALCVALSASFTFAAENTAKTVKKDIPKIEKQQTLNKEVKPLTRAEAREKYEQRRSQEIHKMYADLQLTEEQIKKAENIDAKSKPKKQKAIKDLFNATKKLKEMKVEEVGIIRIKLQKRRAKIAYKKAQKVFEQAQKDFEAILTPVQKENYAKLQEQKRKLYKSNKLKLTGMEENKTQKEPSEK